MKIPVPERLYAAAPLLTERNTYIRPKRVHTESFVHRNSDKLNDHPVELSGSNAAVEDKLDFIVLEFNKNSRRIMVSHTRTFEEDPKLTKAKESNEYKAQAQSASKAVKDLNQKQELLALLALRCVNTTLSLKVGSL